MPNGGSVVGLGTIQMGLFTGQLQCDPAVYGANCGPGGSYECGTNVSCAETYGGVYHVGNSAVYVTQLPVTNVTRRW